MAVAGGGERPCSEDGCRAGPAGARKHLEKELLENRAKQRKLTAELYVPSK